MKIPTIIAGISAAAFILAAGAAMAQGRDAAPPMVKGASETADEGVKHIADRDALQAFAKAGKPAGKAKKWAGKAKKSKYKGKSVARGRGANDPFFCPPGQQKKPGAGSRFQC